MIGLTPKQAHVLAIIRRAAATRQGLAPTYEEISAEMGWISRSTAWHTVERLVDRGYLRRGPMGIELAPLAPGITRRNAAGRIVEAAPLRFIPVRDIRPLNLKQIARQG